MGHRLHRTFTITWCSVRPPWRTSESERLTDPLGHHRGRPLHAKHVRRLGSVVPNTLPNRCHAACDSATPHPKIREHPDGRSSTCPTYLTDVEIARLAVVDYQGGGSLFGFELEVLGERYADPLRFEQRPELNLILQPRAGGVAEAVARTLVTLFEQLLRSLAVVVRDAQLDPYPPGGCTPPGLRPVRPRGRAGAGNPDSGRPRTTRAQLRTRAGRPSPR